MDDGRRRCSEKMSIAFLAPVESTVPDTTLGSGVDSGKSTTVEEASRLKQPTVRSSASPSDLPSLVEGAVRGICGFQPQTTCHVSDDRESSDLETKNKRALRVVYTEEQKFFLMYARIVQEGSWLHIEDRFAELFEPRSKDGLTSMYYRIRKDWALPDVLKTDERFIAEERKVVYEKAAYYSRDFLYSIGYLR